MANILKHAWWTLLLRGIAAILFALLLLFAPGLTLATGAISFVVLFAIYALVDGGATIISAVMRREDQWVLVLIGGLVALMAGLFALANPLFVATISVRLMILVIAFKVISGGIIEMISAWQLRQEIDNEWMLALNGFFSLVFGLILVLRPITAVEVLVLIVSFYLLVSGVLQIVLAFKVRGWSGKIEALQSAAAQS